MSVRRGQTILEYTIIVGIVAVLLSYMGTSIKRGVQSLVKVTADQVGNQQNSDQDFNDAMDGYMIGSNSDVQENNYKQVSELGYIQNTGVVYAITNTGYNDSSTTMSSTMTNGGFSPGS